MVVAAAAQKPVIEKVHVSSVILAAHSNYFMRLFSNGMIESNSESATVQVTEEGEDL
jgi:predicted transcriptional regulator